MAEQLIARVSQLGAESFTRDYRRRGRPVIVTQEPTLATVASNWSLDYLLSKHPGHRVAVEHYPTGDRSLFGSRIDMELAEYVDLIRRDPDSRSRYYLADVDVAAVFPQAAPEIAVPPMISDMKMSDITTFVGIDTFTNAHYHSTPMEGVLTQLCGTKQMILWPPQEYQRLNPYPFYSPYCNWSQFVMCDRAFSPSSIAATRYEFVLEPGQMLFIPQGWIHVARGMGESVSVSYFFRGSWLHAHPAIAARDLASHVQKKMLSWLLSPPLGRNRRYARAVLRIAGAMGMLPKQEIQPL